MKSILLTIAALTAFGAHAGTRATADSASDRLWLQLASHAGATDWVYSPYSTRAAMALVEPGAAGKTRSELTPLVSDLATKLTDGISSSNGVWIDDSFEPLPAYTDTLKSRFGVIPAVAPFAKNAEGARETINAWVSEKTAGKITDLLPSGSVTADTAAVLANALLFKGKWATPFRAEATAPRDFGWKDAKKVSVPTMAGDQTQKYFEDAHVQIADFAYANGSSMVLSIVLPKTEKDFDLAGRYVAGGKRGAWSAKVQPQLLRIALPKFRVAGGALLKDALESIGIRSAFTRTADFSAMAKPIPGRPLLISQVIQRSELKVDEDGTEAAAATAVTMVHATAVFRDPPKRVAFTVNHPFWFALRDSAANGEVYFVGRVVNPAP